MMLKAANAPLMASVLCAVIATVCSGAPIPTPSTENALYSERGMTGFAKEGFDDFVLSAGDTLIGEIHFWGVYHFDVPATDDFELKFYNNSYDPFRHLPDRPSSVAETVEILSLTRTEVDLAVQFTNLAGQEPAAFHYVATITPLTLTPDVRYWLGVSNDTQQGWGWLGSNGGNAHYRSHFFSSLSPIQDEEGFNPGFGGSFYFTAVPEPSSVVLMCLGAAGVCVIGRRRIRAAA